MSSTTTLAQIACVSGPLSSVPADLLLLPWFEDEGPSVVAGLDASVGGELTRALTSKDFSGKAFESLVAAVADQGWRPSRVLLIGAGR